MTPANQAMRGAPRHLRYRHIRVLEVLRATRVTPAMRRITLGGEEIEGFGSGPNVKVLIPAPGAGVPQWPLAGADGRAIWPADPHRPVTRTYSVRRFDARAGELDIDFVLHDEHGQASRWASAAQPGDLVGIGGPGGRTVSAADFYLFAGDQTALPAISAILEKLPADARGEAFIEIPDAGEEQWLARPAGVRVHWLHRGDVAAGRATLLQDAVRAFPWPDAERIFAWIGCESAAMRELRAYVRDERKLDRRSILAIGYWRIGMTETEYGKSFKNDRDEDYFRTMQEEMQAHADARRP